jgi:aldose 1-epimerase
MPELSAEPQDTLEFKTIESPNGALQLEFCPRAGGSITGFRYRGGDRKADLFCRWDNLKGPVPNAWCMASFPLTPYSNRVIDFKLKVDGTVYKIDQFFAEGNQLHGDGWMLPWKIAELGPHHVVLEITTAKRDTTPYVYHARQAFTLENDRLEIAMEITNRTGRRFPFGLGHHPFIPKNGKTILKANLPRVWMTKDRMVPTEVVETPDRWNFSGGKELNDKNFEPADQGLWQTDLIDNCFTGWDQKAEVIWPDRGLRMTIGADPVFKYFVMYMGPRAEMFCAEPVTNIIDAFNLHERGVKDTGTIFLNDGETLKGKMWFRVDSL